MEMKNLIHLLSLFFAAIPLCHATGGGGSTNGGGGGDVIVVDGKTRLRDLVDESNCLWKSGEEAAGKLEHWPRIIETIQVYEPRLVTAIRVELQRLAVCELPDITKKVDTSDSKTAVVFSNQQGRTVALRWNEMIFLNRKLHSKLSERDRAYLFLHEISHSFIAMTAPRRNQSLRSFIAFLSSLEDGPQVSREQFELQLRMNHVRFPTYDGVTEKALLLLTHPASTLREKAAAFYTSLRRCDGDLTFLPPSLRSGENLRAYQIAHYWSGTYPSCVRVFPLPRGANILDRGVGASQWQGYAMIICSAKSPQEAIELDRLLIPLKSDTKEAWDQLQETIQEHVFRGRPEISTESTMSILVKRHLKSRCRDQLGAVQNSR